MIRSKIILILSLISGILNAQDYASLDSVRNEFQQLKEKEDLERFLNLEVYSNSKEEREMIKAYKAAGTCMMADYVFSSVWKLKYFNQGKKSLEELIGQYKQVENVYLRLMIQMNIPKFLNYHKDIDNDLAFLNLNMANSPIEKAYKVEMIENLLSVAKDKEQKSTLELIKVK